MKINTSKFFFCRSMEMKLALYPTSVWISNVVINRKKKKKLSKGRETPNTNS